MPESKLKLPPELQPGSVIHLPKEHELAEFENLLAPLVDPSYIEAVWKHRQPLQEVLKPHSFLGRLGNIVLEAMTEPYEKLQTYEDGGFTMPRRGISLNKEYDDPAAFLGFTLVADGIVSGKGVRSQIQAELWYAPNPQWVKDRHVVKVPSPSELATMKHKMEGQAIRRTITNPKVVTKKDQYVTLHDDPSQRLTLEVLRAAVQRVGDKSS